MVILLHRGNHTRKDDHEHGGDHDSRHEYAHDRSHGHDVFHLTLSTAQVVLLWSLFLALVGVIISTISFKVRTENDIQVLQNDDHINKAEHIGFSNYAYHCTGKRAESFLNKEVDKLSPSLTRGGHIGGNGEEVTTSGHNSLFIMCPKFQ